jgi:hypothetical protein
MSHSHDAGPRRHRRDGPRRSAIERSVVIVFSGLVGFAVFFTVFSGIIGAVADFSAVYEVAGLSGLAAALLCALGVAGLVGQSPWARKKEDAVREAKPEALSRQPLRRTLFIAACFILAAPLAIAPLLGAETDVPKTTEKNSPGSSEADRRPSVTESPAEGSGAAPDPSSLGCEPTDDDQNILQNSYVRLAKAPFEDVDVRVRTGGYVQQEFVARSEYLATFVVIVSRAAVSDESSFNVNAIGNVRLTLYAVGDDPLDLDPIPLKLFSTDTDPNADGVVIPAGPNHMNTTFRVCPVEVQVGRLYAFRVTNEEPGVDLAFSLNRNPGEYTMYLVGASDGQDRNGITYHQVAGIVCSSVKC